MDDGTLIERPLFSFDEKDRWGGVWKLIDGVLRENVVEYELDVLASLDGIHAGVEDANGRRNAYFRVIHVR